MNWPVRDNTAEVHTANCILSNMAAWNAGEDSLAKIEILSGNMPSFLRRFVKFILPLPTAALEK